MYYFSSYGFHKSALKIFVQIVFKAFKNNLVIFYFKLLFINNKSNYRYHVKLIFPLYDGITGNYCRL